ncbi:MAG: hypothetical protein Q7K43_02805, partial [Candidatus Woesearchaeota archaeon]|nr:hypothetical protein [Candidatus Woesearchaeota archaeon]
ERLSNRVRYFFRGTPHDRFLDAIETFYKVCDDVKKQIGKEEVILTGYQDFRELFKEAATMSLEVKRKQEEILNSAGTVFKSTFDAFTLYQGTDEVEKSKLELTRDKAERAYKAEKRNLELLTNVSNDLKTSYNLTRNIVESLETTHENKDGLYQREISFVDTHQVVFTVMDAAYASLYGLNEQARSFKELKSGLNEGLKQVGKIASKVNNDAIEQRYGVSVDPEAVREFNTDLTNHIAESVNLAKQHSALQTKAVAEIEQISQEGVAARQRLAYAFLEAERTDSAEIKLLPAPVGEKLENVVDAQYTVKVEK